MQEKERLLAEGLKCFLLTSPSIEPAVPVNGWDCPVRISSVALAGFFSGTTQ
jgi:hypothetical protein